MTVIDFPGNKPHKLSEEDTEVLSSIAEIIKDTITFAECALGESYAIDDDYDSELEAIRAQLSVIKDAATDVRDRLSRLADRK